MGTSLMSDGFDHHAWATVQLFGACSKLDPLQLESPQAGTYGSIIDTARHLVAADDAYLQVLTGGGHARRADEDTATIDDLLAAIEGNGAAWAAYLSSDPDPDEVVYRTRDDGSETHATVGIRLAQALHHGTDHRSQICTALTSLGVQPPDVDVWDYGMIRGRVTEIPPTDTEGTS